MADFELLALAGFEWDERKSDANLIKHGVSFDDASDIFTDRSFYTGRIEIMRCVGLR